MEAVEAMGDALVEEKPKPSIVKMIMGSLKIFNDCASFATNLTTLAAFATAHFPGLLG